MTLEECIYAVFSSFYLFYCFFQRLFYLIKFTRINRIDLASNSCKRILVLGPV